jgi:hypothetical protein
MIVAWTVYLIFGYMAIGDESPQLGIGNFVRGHNHTYEFCMKFSLQVNNYKYNDGVKLWGYIRQIQHTQNLCLENKFFPRRKYYYHNNKNNNNNNNNNNLDLHLKAVKNFWCDYVLSLWSYNAVVHTLNYIVLLVYKLILHNLHKHSNNNKRSVGLEVCALGK